MLQYDKDDFAVACSMVRWIDANPTAAPIHVYASYWMAFNNIYVTLADFSRKGPALKRDSNGIVKTQQLYGCDMPKLERVTEWDQIDIAAEELADDAKAELVEHENVAFFVRRSPVFDRYPLEKNKAGQKLNGVLNVGYSLSKDYPVWSPVSQEAHAKVKSNSS